MFLESIDYSQFERTPMVWKLEQCIFGNINLIVGKNATGKSRTLNTINGLANLLCGYHLMTYTSGNYKVRFNDNGRKIDYILKYKNRVIAKEKLNIDSKNLLDRRAKGEGEIYYAEENKRMKFQTPESELAIVARRDSIQHPFLQVLSDWGASATHYKFGTTLGQDRLAVFTKKREDVEKQKLDLKDQNIVIAAFRDGEKKYSTEFTKSIVKDMAVIGYELTDIGISRPRDIVIDSNVPISGDVLALYVQESDLRSRTYQHTMSQGMFRTLSLLIQITYSQLSGIPSCILIDDIGEGLDYERSSSLIKLLIERVKVTNVQLIMATNDRFVMNNVPLEYWSVIHRTGGVCKIYNYRNSPKLFDDFALTGLNNFDFFSSNYYLKDTSEN